MMRSGIAYPLPTLAPLTYGTGFGSSPTHSIPTPTVSDKIVRRETYGQLNYATNKAVTLNRFAMMFPTPTKVTGTGGTAMCKWGGAGSRAKQRKMVSPEELNGALNPDWVEWLMGFPIGWTALEPSETP